MTTTPPATSQPIRGKVIEAEIKVSVAAARPLPLACGLYAVETPEGVWLCAYYGANRSVFDFLPQKGAEVDERELGIAFHTKEFVPKERYHVALWEDFKKKRLMAYDEH